MCHPCVSGCGRYLAPGDGHDRCLMCLGRKHAEVAFVDESCSHCGKMIISELRARLRFLDKGAEHCCLCLDLVLFLAADRRGLLQAVARVVWGLQWWQTLQGINPRGTIAPLALRNQLSCQWNVLGPLHGAYQQYPWCSSWRPDVDCCIGGWAGAFWRRRFDCAAAPAVAMPQSDPEIMAMLSRATERVGLEWRPPPCPEPSRLDDWFLGVACAGSQHPAPVPLSQRCMGSLPGRGRHLLLPETDLLAPPSPPLRVVQLGGIRGSPRWSGQLRCSCVLIPPPPSRANRASPSGPVGTRLVWPAMLMWPVEKLPPPYAMALLQVLQAKSTEGSARGCSWSGSSERAPNRDWPRIRSDEGRPSRYEDGVLQPLLHQSRGGNGNAALTGSKSQRPATILHPVVRHLISPGRSALETGLQACRGSHGCLHHRLGGHVQWACSVGGLEGPPTALVHQLPRVAGSTPGLEPPQDLRGKHVLVCTDNTATVAYINWQGGLRSHHKSQLAHHLLLCAFHIPGLHNRAADELSRAALPGEWRLHPQTVQLIWRCFGIAQVDLFASIETSHCQ